MRRFVWRRVRRWLGGGLAVVVAGLLMTPTGCYLSRAGWEEARILKHRKLITSVLNDTAVDPATRAKLRLVVAARRFAIDSIHLTAGESFTKYTRVERDTLVLVLSAAYRDELRPYTWWFPIVGRVPYKGYFDFGAAKRAAAGLEREGFDTYLRPSSAFSTLGWFNDPLLSTSLAADSLDLANTVIHELTHNTFYASGQAIFNESFANFTGARGAAWFFRCRGDTAAAAEVDRRWADELSLGQFWTGVYNALDSAFAAHPGDAGRAARLAARDTIYTRARARLADAVAPTWTTIDPRYARMVRFDNASLMARRIYLTDLGLFEDEFAREDHDLRKTITAIIAIAGASPKDPFGGLRRAVGPPDSATAGR